VFSQNRFGGGMRGCLQRGSTGKLIFQVIHKKNQKKIIFEYWFNGLEAIRKYLVAVRRIYYLGFCAIFLWFSVETFATAYYVSPDGTDLNPGSLGSPFKTISKGLLSFSGGDTLFVRGGTYDELVVVRQKGGTDNNPTVIMAYPGENPVIKSASILEVVRIWDNYVHFSGFEIESPIGSGILGIGAHITISNCTVHDCWGSGIHVLGDYCIVELCTVYNTCLSNKPNPGSAQNGSGISACRDNTDGYTEYAILRHNTVHDNWGEGLSAFEADHITIENNTIYDNWSVNLYVSDATNCLVERNLVYQTKDMTGGAQVGIGLWDETSDPASNNNTVINNIAYGCKRNLYVDKWNNSIISNNTFVNSTYLACVQITGTHQEAGTFVNNIVIQEGVLVPIYNVANSNFRLNHNLWSKTPVSSAAGTGDIVGDPGLAKTGSLEAEKLSLAYFKLLESSPAIDKGVVVDPVKIDLLGNLRDALPDLGAFEHILNVSGIVITGAGGANSITTYSGTLLLSATIIPDNASNKNVSWSLQNGTGKASINSEGLLSAIADGTVTVVATANDGSGVSGTLEIEIFNQGILTAINSMDDEPFLVQMNNSELTIQLNSDIKYKNIGVFNLYGKLIFNCNLDKDISVYDISNLLPGVYIVMLFGDTVKKRSVKVCKL
jgi:parallel beta-helix repeat protein